MDFSIAGLGLTILLISGDMLVRGAVNLSLRVGLPPLIVGLTIVSFGTSAPELLIAIEAIDDNAAGLALGNVVGSNTANILLVLGIPALLAGLHTSHCKTKHEYLIMMFASVVFIGLCFVGPLIWWHGLILLTILAFYLGSTFLSARRHTISAACPSEDQKIADLEGADPNLPYWRISFYLVLGLIGLPLGADLLVDSSISLARDLGISEVVIGLTLVAIGTSLPELATTVVAALRRHADVALGNVIGSNIFNILGIIGIATLIGPIPVASGFLHLDLWIMLGASMLLFPFVFFKQDITRVWGFALTVLYGVYLFTVLA